MIVPDEKTCAFLACCLLSSVLLLVHEAGPPVVDIEALGAEEDGMIVAVQGVIASLYAYDSGTEYLVLGDSDSGFTVGVVCSPGIKDAPSRYMSYGDIVGVKGRVSCDGTSTIIYCDSDSVTLVSTSDRAIDVVVLSSCWELLEGDRINVTGILAQSPQGSGYVLRDWSGNFSIEARPSSGAYPVLTGVEVVVDSTMFLDRESMTFVLVIWAIHPT